MIAFFCSTPYQIFTAINIKLNKYQNSKADIYILNHFEYSEKMSVSIENSRIFNEVISLDVYNFSRKFSKNTITRYYNYSCTFLLQKKILKKYFHDIKYYEKIFLTYPDVIIQLFIINNKKKYPNSKIFMYEDGLNTYYKYEESNSLLKKIFKKIYKSSDVIDFYDQYLLFKPELSNLKFKEKLQKIPNINSEDTNFVRKLNSIFEYDQTKNIIEKVILFEQPYPVELINEKSEFLFKQIGNACNSNSIMKVHPRSKKKYKDINTFHDKTIPWEVIVLNENIEDKVLISVFSTACFTPKLILDKEPIVIFLYKLIEIKQEILIDNNLMELVEKFKYSYRDKSKIIIPETYDELLNIIKNLDI